MSNDKAMMDKNATAQPAGFMHQQNASEWRGSKLIGASIYGPDNKSIGDINDVLIGNDGRVTAVVVGVGGFLGVGEKNVALPFQALNVERKADGTVDRQDHRELHQGATEERAAVRLLQARPVGDHRREPA